MRKMLIVVEYDGTNYSGWQIQPNAPSIQEELEKAIAHLTSAKTRVYGAGRTDAGVHARGQVACFMTDATIPTASFAPALCSRLPKDIAVRESREVPSSFDPRHDAKLKLYRYCIHNSPIRPAIGRHYLWHLKQPLELAPMLRAAALLEGTHDFTSLSNQERNTPEADNVRTVDSCTLRREGEVLTIDVIGRSFLYNMVRNIAGLLADIGCGRFAPEEVPGILAARDRSRAGQGAPACGLCLEWIKYGNELADGEGGRE